MKNKKGITMISLVITIIVLLILTSITIYNGLGQLGIKRVNNLYADIDSLSTKVAEYYIKNEKIPINNEPYVENKDELKAILISNGATETANLINVNDEGAYYVLDLSKLDNLTLNYGDDYKTWNSSEPKSQNVYIINTVTHQIYFPHGVKSGDEYYFARFPDENEISPIELEEINSDWTMNITNISGTNIGEDSISIVADVTLSGLTENYDLNSLEYAWAETNAESEIANITFTKFNSNSESEGNINATLASKVLSNTAEYYYLWVKVVDINGKTSYKYLTNSASPLTSNLPSNYQKVEYIESTGEQWIDTEVIANDVDQINIMFSLTDNKAIYGIVGGGWTRDNNTFQVIYNNSTNLISLRWGTASVSKTYDTNKHNAILSRQKISIDDTQLDHNYSVNDARNVYLFARRTDNMGNGIQQYAFCRIYNCMITGNNINKNFIPCYRKSDNINGLYDLVEGKFYTNQGTGDDFIAGENVY